MGIDSYKDFLLKDQTTIFLIYFGVGEEGILGS